MKLDHRIIQLIAVGASVAANCQPCLEYNLGKARECGIDEREITEAIAVAKMVRKGAAAKMDELAMKLNGKLPMEAESPDAPASCCC
jgi:AhpD family alkylhydroperoxidase